MNEGLSSHLQPWLRTHPQESLTMSLRQHFCARVCTEPDCGDSVSAVPSWVCDSVSESMFCASQTVSLCLGSNSSDSQLLSLPCWLSVLWQWPACEADRFSRGKNSVGDYTCEYLCRANSISPQFRVPRHFSVLPLFF